MNTKRLARTALAVIVTVGIVVAIIVGCGPKWGNGTATGKTGSQSTATAHTAATVDVQLPSYYMDNMVFQRDQPIVVKGNVSSTESNPDRRFETVSDTYARQNLRERQGKGSEKRQFHLHAERAKGKSQSVFAASAVRRQNRAETGQSVCGRRLRSRWPVEYGTQLCAVL